MKTYKIVEKLIKHVSFEVLAHDENEARSLAGLYRNYTHEKSEQYALEVYVKDDDERYRLMIMEVG